MKFAVAFTLAILCAAVFTAAFIPAKVPAGGNLNASTVVHQNGIAY